MGSDAVLDLLREAADTLIVPRFRALGEGEVMEKNPGDLVTVADREAEVFITERLHAAYPDAVILGEEATSADPTLLQRFAQAEHAFTLDPVDGTRNFVHGRPQYAVMASEVRDGEPVRAWIWQPETGVAWTAEHGAGVYRDGTRVTVPVPPDDPADWIGMCSRPAWKTLGDPAVGRLVDTGWCCGFDYPSLIEGAGHYLLYVHGAPWDHFPGGLMLREAGGVVRLWDGGRWRPEVQSRGSVAAASEHVADRVVAALGHLWA